MAARRNENRSHCKWPTYMDRFVSKTQGTISRTFAGGTPQNFEVIINRLPTPFRKNRQLQTPQIMSNFMLHISQSIHLPSPKHTEITHHQTPDKKTL